MKKEIIITILLVIVLLALLWKFDFFKSKDTKQAEALNTDPALGGDLNPKNEITKALATKVNKPASQITPNDVKKSVPHANSFGRWIQQIWDAKGTFSDDEDKVYDVFRNMASKLESNVFAKTFGVIKGRDLYGFMATFMNDEELANVYKIINAKPLA